MGDFRSTGLRNLCPSFVVSLVTLPLLILSVDVLVVGDNLVSPLLRSVRFLPVFPSLDPMRGLLPSRPLKPSRFLILLISCVLSRYV